MVYRRAERSAWFVEVPTRHGERVKRSTGTTHRPTALAMERMLIVLGPRGQRAWDLLERVTAKKPTPPRTRGDYALGHNSRLTLARLFDAYSHNRLDDLRASFADVDLEAHVAGWTRWLAERVKPATVTLFTSYVGTLIPAGAPFPRRTFTGPAIATWLATRTALVQKRRQSTARKSRRVESGSPRSLTGATRRKYLAAVRSFATYLVELGILDVNPARDVQAPPPSRPRVVELDLRDVRRIVDAARPPYRGLFALLYGAGVEISAALACTEADVDTARREVRARGTKEHTRDRVVRVAEWAWPEFAKHLETLTPGERIFRGLDRWKVGEQHSAILAALNLPHHRVHDARHFYAVRAVRAGTPYELVARQLGHADVMMVARVYGVYAPRSDERDRWERIAAQLDAPISGAMGTATGTSVAGMERDEAPNPSQVRGFGDGAWGARTPDPRLAKAEPASDSGGQPPPPPSDPGVARRNEEGSGADSGTATGTSAGEADHG